MGRSLHLLSRNRRRAAGEPSKCLARLGWVMLKLIADRSLEYALYRDHFGLAPHEFQRDLRKLRAICHEWFTISRMSGGRVLVNGLPGRLSLLPGTRIDTAAVLRRIAGAIGLPADALDASDDFLQLRYPRPAMSPAISQVFAFFQSAAAGPARVEFAYRARGQTTMRRVEPYHVVLREGRYYLVAYDLARNKGWRHFGLDAIDARTLHKEGTFARRAIPEAMLADRSVGWISGGTPLDVTIRLSPVVAQSATARTWQEGQRVESLPDGGAEITFFACDPAEAVRWAMRFGAEASVVAPAQAVALARDTAARIAVAYEELARQPRIAG